MARFTKRGNPAVYMLEYVLDGFSRHDTCDFDTHLLLTAGPGAYL